MLRIDLFLYMTFNLLFIVALCLIFNSCSSEEPQIETLFTLVPSTHTNIDFENRVEDTSEFSILNYLYFYDGGGVAVGDINNNGLPDIFFIGNDVENRLYINKGDFVFEDITHTAGVVGEPGGWSKGATMADVNGNGYLDIYVSRLNHLNKSGANQLFINNGDGTFTERAAEYGLDFVGYSTQAVFFDYNNNGRLDMFLMNHSFHSDRTHGRADLLRDIHDPKAGDRLFRNDGDKFTDVTEEAGIYSSALGYGLGVAVSDINKNGWLDIYIGNDFHEDDYLYINNGDGTFTETLYSSIGHTSVSSMGNDIADITNNGYVDIVSLDMMPEDRELFMRTRGPDRYDLAQIKKDLGFGDKNARNTLQLNRGNAPDGTPLFSEIAFLSGIARTDWSWASLFMDMNNNGLKDLFVTNGMVRRPLDLDYIRIYNSVTGREEVRQTSLDQVPDEVMELLKFMPELKIPNYAYQNNGDFTFTNRAEEWGLGQPTISSGVAYADLNNNGRLDLIVNNVNMPAFIYKNNPADDGSANYLKLKLNGSEMNTSGIGSKAILYNDNQIFYQEQMPTRGFQSSVDHILHFGLGDITQVDSLIVIWTDRSYQILTDVEVNKHIELYHEEATGIFDYSRLHRNWENAQFKNVTDEMNLEYSHNENEFNDFSREPLLPYKLSTQGPALAVADVTGNGLDDFYIGGARWQAGKLFLQQLNGSFQLSYTNEDVFEEDLASEDVDAIFFDATGNGLPDLYVVSGGGELTGIDPALLDRLYINEGDGQFKKSKGQLPEFYINGSIVRAADFNNNGSVDLFIGGRSIPFRYGESPESFLLLNDGKGIFRDATEEIAPKLKHIGMVTDAEWAYISNELYPDLVVVGEWMPIHLFQNNGSSLIENSEDFGLSNEGGLWQSVIIDDVNFNGLPDIIAGNFGKNSRIQASPENPLRLYINDFDGDGQMAPLIANKMNGEFYPFEQIDELLMQHRFLSNRISSYRDYASQTVVSLFGREEIESSIVKEIKELGSVLYINGGNGTFNKMELPIIAQSSPVMAIHTIELKEFSHKEILFAGNLFDVKPSMGGRQDANYGIHLKIDDDGSYQAQELQNSGFLLNGEVRNIKNLRTRNGNIILVALNNDSPQFFEMK